MLSVSALRRRLAEPGGWRKLAEPRGPCPGAKSQDDLGSIWASTSSSREVPGLFGEGDGAGKTRAAGRGRRGRWGGAERTRDNEGKGCGLTREGFRPGRTRTRAPDTGMVLVSLGAGERRTIRVLWLEIVRGAL